MATIRAWRATARSWGVTSSSRRRNEPTPARAGPSTASDMLTRSTSRHARGRSSYRPAPARLFTSNSPTGATVCAGPGSRDEQLPAEVVGGVAHTRQREEVAAAARADVVDEWLVDQALLHRLELPLQVLLEAGEHQPDVEVAVRVDAAVVAEAAAQDPAVLGLGGARVREPNVAVEPHEAPGRVVPVVRRCGLG